jgi:dTMP kinase
MFAARFDNVTNLIIPSLKQGTTVITDRFDGSSYAYQVGSQSDGALEELFWHLREQLIVVPDMYVFVDVDPLEGIRRTRNRNSLSDVKQYDHFDDREIEFHKKVREGYMKFFTEVPHMIIDANRPLADVQMDFTNTIRNIL